MHDLYSDITIVGGGTASLFLASELLSSDDSVIVQVLERGSAQRKSQGVLVHPLTQKLFERLNTGNSWVWSDQVHRFREFASNELLSDLEVGSTDDAGNTRYPSNCQLSALDNHLLAALSNNQRFKLAYQVEVTGARREGLGWTLELETPAGASNSHCEFLVVSDGKGSPLRDAVGIPYEQVHFPGRVDILAVRERRSESPAVSMVVGSDGATTVVDNGMGENTLIFDMRPDGKQPEPPGQLREIVRNRARVAGLNVPAGSRPLFSTSIRSTTVSCGTWLGDGAVLFGDAAHAMHNLGGQGFNLAIQNAAAMSAGLLELAQHGEVAPLRKFEDFRLPYITELQVQQNRLFSALSRGETSQLSPDGWLVRRHRGLTDGQPRIEDFIQGLAQEPQHA